MTHAVGKGTVNVQVNMLATERRVLVALAADQDVSLGSLVKRLYLVGIWTVDQKAGQQIADLRRKHRVSALQENSDGDSEALAGGVE